MPLPLARTPAEGHLYIQLHPCACGEVETEFESHVLLYCAEGMAGRHELRCPPCGSSRHFTFLLPDWPLQSSSFRFGDDQPSQLLDPGEWLWVADATATDALRAGATGADLRESMEYAAAAADETMKFLPPGAAAIPEHLFVSDLGQAVRDACPTAFERRHLRRHVERLRGGERPPPTENVAIPWDPRHARPTDIMRNALLDRLLDRIRRYVRGDRAAVLEPDTLLEVNALIDRHTTFDVLGTFEAAQIRWLRYEVLPEDKRQDDLAAALRLFAAVRDAAPAYRDLGLVEMIPRQVRLLLAVQDGRPTPG
nr:hypothetical protein [Micromonospora sp. DSM 115978]